MWLCPVPFFRTLMMRKVRTMMCQWGSFAVNRKTSLHTRSPFTTMHPQWESSWRETLWWMLRACPRPCTLSSDLPMHCISTTQSTWRTLLIVLLKVEGRVWALHTGICSVIFFTLPFFLLSFSHTFLFFHGKHLVFVNVKMFSRAEFYLASLSTKFEEAQYNIVMIGGKEEEIFFLFMQSLRKLHTRSLLGHGFVSFLAEKNTCPIKKIGSV